MTTAREAAQAIERRLGGIQPRVAIVLGSGMGQLTAMVQAPLRIPFADIPGFPAVGVGGHQGEVVVGMAEQVPVLMQSGRFHLYEGHAPATIALPIRTYATLGVETLILTNAAGGIKETLAAGSLVMITDHINLMARNPLIGPVEPGEERFPDMSEPYERRLQDVARTVATEVKVQLEEGVYVALLGPSYETPAEVRMLRRLGADVVGMSTVPEVIVARARGLRCLAFSVVTNPAAGLSAGPLDHRDVLATITRVAGDLDRVVRGVLRRLSD